MKRLWGRFFARMTLVGVVMLTTLSVGAVALHKTSPETYAAQNNACNLSTASGTTKHVIYVEFDNVHLTRDNPNVPSDLEQMPNLLNFITGNGTMLAKQHTPLIAHTATNIITTLSGVYGDRHGIPVSNSFRYFKPDGTTSSAGSFAYWTAPLNDAKNTTNSAPQMINEQGKIAPAPWVPYTRAGCNFGAVAAANTILENTGVDIPAVFGANSPEAQEVKSDPGQAYADFVGIGVHCAQGNALCASQNNGKADALPDEPGSYVDYQGLFGHKYVAPQLSPNGPLTDLNGNVIQDEKKHIGFPGFDGMTPAVTLSYIAAMQEHNVPVTYAYISDAHDNHAGAGAYGPGQAGYVSALKTYDEAFGKFFTRLQADGITKDNTLFVFTADEGDHFVGGAPTPANCDGINVPCTYSQVGELNTNLTGLLATQQNVTTPFTVHADSAPTIYLTGNPARDAAVTRQFGQALAQLNADNLMTGKSDKLTNYLADAVEMKLLHMVTADPTRTPTLTQFANPDYFLYAGAPNCTAACVTQNPAFAWNHGDFSPDINTTWLGLVGPGVRHIGIDNNTWADHTDTRPTMLALLGLKDDYRHDGRVLFEVLTSKALPKEVRANLNFYIAIARIYKQLNAPVGELGQLTLRISTNAIASNTSNDSTYTQLEDLLTTITNQRNTIANTLITVLDSASFGGHTDRNAAQKAVGQSLELLHSVKSRIVKR